MNLTFNDHALVLRRERWREHDKRVTLYTFEHGKIDAVAVGASKILSKLGSHLEPMREVSVMIASGTRDGGAKIAQAVTDHAFASFADDTHFGQRIAAMGLVAHVVDFFTERGVPDAQQYALAREGWRSLSVQTSADGLSHELGVILYALLGHVGCAPQFERCVMCGRHGDGVMYEKFSSSQGGVVCDTCVVPADAMPYTITTPRLTFIKEFLRWRI